MFHGDARRSGCLEGTTGPTKPRLRWKFAEADGGGGPFLSSPAVADGRVFIGCDTGTLYAFDAHKGTVQWTVQADWQIFSSPAVSGGRAYFGEGLHEADFTHLRCVDAANGQPLWRIPVPGHTESSPTVVGDRVYFGCGEAGLWCADARTGKVLWKLPGYHLDGSPLVVEGRVYVGAGYGKTGILSVDAATGKLLQFVRTPLAVWGDPAYHAGRIYFGLGDGNFEDRAAGKRRGEVRCLEARTLKPLWNFATGDAVLAALAVTVPAGRRPLVLVTCRDRYAYALDAESGTVVWKRPIGSPSVSSPAVVGDLVYFGANDGRVRALRLADGALAWQYDTRPLRASEEVRLFSSPAIAHGRLYIGTGNAHVICLEQAGP